MSPLTARERAVGDDRTRRAAAPARPRQAKTARGELTRRRLLAAAERIFGEKGFFAASIVDITRAAGVSLGTFYVYFPSKAEIFRELVLELSRELRRRIAERVAGARDRVDFERRGFEAFFSFVHEHRNLYRIVRQAEWIDPALYRTYYEAIHDGYARGLAEAQARGEVRPELDPDTLALCLMAMGDYLGMRWLLWEGRMPPQRAVDTLLKLAFDGMRGPALAGVPASAVPQPPAGRNLQPSVEGET